MSHKVTVIPGDGIGPEVIGSAVRLLEALQPPLELLPAEMGLECHRRTGSYLPQVTLEALQGSEACLFGAINSPPTPTPDYQSPLLFLRQHFDLFANVRPVKRLCPDLGLVDLDLTIVRENTEGMYTGLEHEGDGYVTLERRVSERVCRRLVRFAMRLCSEKGYRSLTCVHKANVLRRSDGLFRRVFFEEMADSELVPRELLVDAAAAAMITRPKDLECLVTLNLYGDILSDEAAALVGGLGFAPSANLGDSLALFEPSHGSAPDIAGKDMANPVAAMLSTAMMLRHLHCQRGAWSIENAVQGTLEAGIRTRDAGGNFGTRAFTDEVLHRL